MDWDPSYYSMTPFEFLKKIIFGHAIWHAELP